MHLASYCIIFFPGFMVSVTNTGVWLGLAIMNQLGPVLASSPLKISGTFFLFASFTLVLFLIVLLLLPETKVSRQY